MERASASITPDADAVLSVAAVPGTRVLVLKHLRVHHLLEIVRPVRLFFAVSGCMALPVSWNG